MGVLLVVISSTLSQLSIHFEGRLDAHIDLWLSDTEFHLVDGREELLDEIKAASVEVQSYIANEISRLLDLSNFEYAVQSQAGGNTEREDVIFERLDAFAALAPGESL